MNFITDGLKRFVALIAERFNDAERRSREAYLAEATDLVDLELRQRALANQPSPFARQDFFARG
ncbi:DUF3563 family protein [Burkholderia ubonensis]|uniref:DUF3563 family protein n=1 Tax=Burkholderia ubonensis TaxID=101571 RepID=UPI00075AF790|nr:DUF3563 family protein [Burkholderia ubonensis]KVP17179.1 hypothetical protein WJ84_02550 [Burkholderia ubonensis]KVP39696.1 hypothetical protein WJ87_05800 [Burkholderia ubonensis]